MKLQNIDKTWVYVLFYFFDFDNAIDYRNRTERGSPAARINMKTDFLT